MSFTDELFSTMEEIYSMRRQFRESSSYPQPSDPTFTAEADRLLKDGYVVHSRTTETKVTVDQSFTNGLFRSRIDHSRRDVTVLGGNVKFLKQQWDIDTKYRKANSKYNPSNSQTCYSSSDEGSIISTFKPNRNRRQNHSHYVQGSVSATKTPSTNSYVITAERPNYRGQQPNPRTGGSSTYDVDNFYSANPFLTPRQDK